MALDAIVVEDAADGGLGLQLGKLELGVLEVEDRLAEGLALLDVVDSQRQRPLDHGDRRGADLQALLRQLLHQLDEALAFLVAEQVGRRHAHVIEEQLRRVVRLEPDLVEVAAALEAFDLVGLDHDQRGALGALRRIGLGHHDDQVGKLAVGDEGLGTVDAVLVAVLLGARLDALQVGAGTRLGHGDGPDQFAGRHPRQPLLLLFLRAVVEDVGCDDGIVERDAETVDADMADRLDDGALMRERAARTAILLRHGGAQQAVVAGLLPAGAVEDLGLLEGVVVRRDLLAEEALRHVVEHGDVVAHPAGLRQFQDGCGASAHENLPIGSTASEQVQP